VKRGTPPPPPPRFPYRRLGRSFPIKGGIGMYQIQKNGRDVVIDGKPLVVGSVTMANKVVATSNQAMVIAGRTSLFSWREIKEENK
jgi:hypothetical protein